MRSPRKVYAVISKKAKRGEPELYNKRPRALRERDNNNATELLGVSDWRVETYVKGD